MAYGRKKLHPVDEPEVSAVRQTLESSDRRVAMQAVFSAASIALSIVILLSAIAKSADVKHETGKGVQQIQLVAQTK
jgi:hypothetical protein